MLLLLLRTPTALATRPEARCPSCEMGDLQLGAEKFFEARHGSGGTLQTEKLSPWPPLTSPPEKPPRRRWEKNRAIPPEHWEIPLRGWENQAIPPRGWGHREHSSPGAGDLQARSLCLPAIEDVHRDSRLE